MTRIRLQARLGNVRQTVQIDFGVGDAVHPQSQVIEYPVLLAGSPIKLHAYPVGAAIAEKFHAMVYCDPTHVRQWGAFVRRIGEAALADDFARVAGDLVRFLMPVAEAAVTSVTLRFV